MSGRRCDDRRARELGFRVFLGCMEETSLGIAASAAVAGLVDWVDLDGNLLLIDDPFAGLSSMTLHADGTRAGVPLGDRRPNPGRLTGRPPPALSRRGSVDNLVDKMVDRAPPIRRPSAVPWRGLITGPDGPREPRFRHRPRVATDRRGGHRGARAAPACAWDTLD